MLTFVAQRYTAAVVAFAIALVWFGIGIRVGFESLLVFTLVYLLSGVVQHRRRVKQRRATHGRSRHPRRRDFDELPEEDVEVWTSGADWPSMTSWSG